MLSFEEARAIDAKMIEAGYPVIFHTGLVEKYVGDSLTAGVYTPIIQGMQRLITCAPRRKGGRPYGAIPFKNQEGKEVKISIGSIMNSIRVVTSLQPTALADNAKWAGETAQPTVAVYRYGALSDMNKEETPGEDNTIDSAYEPIPVTLTTEVVYVIPRFVEGGNGRPIYDEQCSLGKCFVVSDYMSHRDTNAH